MDNPAKDFNNGKFVISLDFELMWGMRDKRTIENYGSNIKGVHMAMPAMLALFEAYNVKVTCSTVGFLFAKDIDELKESVPALKPQYTNVHLSPYGALSGVGKNEKEDPYYFGFSLLQDVINKKMHEIGTHTFCHYYCLEPGQTIQAFRSDLEAAKNIAAKSNIRLRSLVFPRNQFNQEYLAVCEELGIDSYRGNPLSWLYEARNAEEESRFRRALRLLDAYVNITGHHCHSRQYIVKERMVNVAASRFLRPWSSKLSMFDGLRLRRIKRAMLYAARTNKLFHLWWHPHNFGVHLEENLQFLENILKYYQLLAQKYRLESSTMSSIADEVKRNHE